MTRKIQKHSRHKNKGNKFQSNLSIAKINLSENNNTITCLHVFLAFEMQHISQEPLKAKMYKVNHPLIHPLIHKRHTEQELE